MAKDRFKTRASYDNTFKYGFTKMNHYKIPDRKELSDRQREWLVKTVKECNSESGKKFLRSILVENKIPTERQKIVIRDIIRKL